MLTCWRLADWEDLGHGSENVSNAICASRKIGIPVTSLDWIEFMPDPAGYFCKTTKGECYWNNVPDSLNTHLQAHGGKNTWGLSVGKGGAWVTVDTSGHVTWDGISESLEKKLKQSTPGNIVVSSTLTRSGNCALIQALTVRHLVPEQ
jgi:hypothetical protein